MSRVRRLTVVLLLNLGLVTALVVVGLAARSLAVLAAGVDYLADAAAVAVSLLAIWLESRPPSPARPHGYPRATNIAALVIAMLISYHAQKLAREVISAIRSPRPAPPPAS